MIVEVGYEIDEELTEDHVRGMRRAAENLTDDRRSIRVERSEAGDRHVMIVRFTMRTMAHYKVVGDISHQFKLHFACFHLYRDTWIAFPKADRR